MSSLQPADDVMVDCWLPLLGEDIEGLNVTETEDRVRFRLRVLNRTRSTRVDLLRSLALALGAETIPTTRGGAVRVLADAYMARRAETS